MLAVVGNSNSGSGGHGSSSMDLGRDSPPKNLWFYKVSWTRKSLLAKHKKKCCRLFFSMSLKQCRGSCFWASRILIYHYLYGFGSIHQQTKKVRKTLISTVL
jgi:hypothetical protein